MSKCEAVPAFYYLGQFVAFSFVALMLIGFIGAVIHGWIYLVGRIMKWLVRRKS